MIAFVDFNVPTAKRSVISGQILFRIGGRVLSYQGKIHTSEPESGNGNVNTVYFVTARGNQARENTRISRTEFVYDE